MTAKEYARLDIGEVNLECADKLHGSENLDITKYAAILDQWAEQVADKTKRYWFKFRQDPADYCNSEAYFRMLVLVTVLQRDIGVRYAKNSLEVEFDCTNSELHFIHGIIESGGGACATMPVLYIAIGRRLGYPLRLVQAVEHLFVRWDNPVTGERFNIESTSEGLNVRPDSYYHTWPAKIISQHVKDGWLLKSMSPQEELSVFYETRARCFLDWMDFRNALELAYYATELAGGEANPYRAGFKAVATVLYRADTGLAKYGVRRAGGKGIVRENGLDRPMEEWEQWAVDQAENELGRIARLHAARRRKKMPHIASQEVLRLADDQPRTASDAFFEQEELRCTTRP